MSDQTVLLVRYKAFAGGYIVFQVLSQQLPDCTYIRGKNMCLASNPYTQLSVDTYPYGMSSVRFYLHNENLSDISSISPTRFRVSKDDLMMRNLYLNLIPAMEDLFRRFADSLTIDTDIKHSVTFTEGQYARIVREGT